VRDDTVDVRKLMILRTVATTVVMSRRVAAMRLMMMISRRVAATRLVMMMSRRVAATRLMMMLMMAWMMVVTVLREPTTA